MLALHAAVARAVVRDVRAAGVGFVAERVASGDPADIRPGMRVRWLAIFQSPLRLRVPRLPCVLLFAGLMLAPDSAAQSASAPTTSTAGTRRRPRFGEQGFRPAGQAERARSGRKKNEKKPDDDVGFRWKGYPSLHLGKGTHIDLRARRSVRCATALIRRATIPTSAESDFARRRIALEGEIRSVVAFEIDRELDGENPWRDVYANYQQFDFVQVQGGKFKLPFSLDENTSPTNLDFVYRSLAARVLAPGRDRGVMVHGRLLDRIVRYELGVFDHDGRNARTRNLERVSGDRTLAGRVVAQPFRSVEVDRGRSAGWRGVHVERRTGWVFAACAA